MAKALNGLMHLQPERFAGKLRGKLTPEPWLPVRRFWLRPLQVGVRPLVEGFRPVEGVVVVCIGDGPGQLPAVPAENVALVTPLLQPPQQ